MNIRKAEVDDLDNVLALNEQIGWLHYDNAPDSFVAPSVADREFILNALNNESRLFLLAEVDAKVVGFITASVTRNETIPFLVTCPICRVGTIVVDETCQSSGVGTALMSACHAWAKLQGAEQIRLEVMAFNTRAQTFYENLGFENQSHMMLKRVS